MLLPTRIEVRNIRSIPHAVIEPAKGGITALTGPIGVGKSTLFNAVLWTCYGEVGGIPGALVQSEMRRTDCPDGEPAEAVVEFDLDGDSYRAVRTLRRRTRAGKPIEVASAQLWINGAEQPQITPSKLTEKITALTGLSGRAYAGAFFCAQNHLPALAEGTPSEVQRLIEDQTMLSPLTKKIDTARSAASDAQVAADALPGSLDDVDAAQSEVDAAQAEGQRLWTQLETARARTDKTRATWETARSDHQALAARHRAAQQAHLKVADVTARITSTTDQVTELTAEAVGLPQVDADEVKRGMGTLRAAVTAAERAQHVLATATEADADARAGVTAAQTTGRFPEDLDDQYAHAVARLARAQGSRGALHGEHQRLTRAIDAIRDSGPTAAECPTCTQRLPDARALLMDLLAQRETTTTNGTAARAAVDAEEEQVRTFADQIRERDHASAELERRAASADTARARLAAAREEAATTLEGLCQITGGDPTGDPSGLIEQAQQQLDAHAAQLAAADRATQLADQIASRNATLTELNRTLDQAQTAAADTVDDDEVVAAETRAAEAHAAYSAEDVIRQQAETEAHVAAERARATEAARDRATDTLDRKAEALTKADTLRHAHQMLTALRRDLLTDYTSAISDAASHLMEQVGGGTHVGVVIDDTFVPQVVLASGERRPMRVLSGGEKARAALCLRLGIADQITGGSGAGMVFADEVTANQDEDTTREVVELIRGLGRPMVLIGHAPQIAQIANRVYECAKPDETVGTVVTAAGASLSHAVGSA